MGGGDYNRTPVKFKVVDILVFVGDMQEIWSFFPVITK